MPQEIKRFQEPAAAALLLLFLALGAGWSVNPFPAADAAASAAETDVLADPVALGAWLFKAHCGECHGPYARERLAGEYADASDLTAAISGAEEGCRIRWARRYGGSLKEDEIAALVRYMTAYEENDGPPPLPELPEIPSAAPPPPPEETSPGPKASDGPEEVDEVLRRLMDQNPVVHGAWIYTRNCYRCHLAYEKARMGRGTAADTIKRTVVNGKTSTQMKPFSRMKGGNLANVEIDAVVAYIAAWEKHGEPLALPAAVLVAPAADPAALLPIGLPQFPRPGGDGESGRRRFARTCTRCHGPGGEGYLGPSLRKTWWSLRPDLLVKSVLKQGVPGTPMAAWSQNAGGPLSAKDIEDLVSYLVALR
jgi:mono/diheme cytochrome c family protein